MFPLGFWLLFEAGDRALSGKSYFGRTGFSTGFTLLALAGLFGVILDYHMVVLTGILKFYAVGTPGTAVQMYVGWGLCLPAIYESYAVTMALIGSPSSPDPADKPAHPAQRAFAVLHIAGMFLVCIPLFTGMWLARPPGPLLILSFTGMLLMMEYVQWKRRRASLLSITFGGGWRPWAAMALASIPYTLLWERLNGLMGSWVYRGIFWLQPTVWHVPLVAILGYLFWYILFLSFLSALSERDLRVWT